jgi:hypothetical protein
LHPVEQRISPPTVAAATHGCLNIMSAPLV